MKKNIKKMSWEENIEHGYPKREMVEDFVTLIGIVAIVTAFVVVLKVLI